MNVYLIGIVQKRDQVLVSIQTIVFVKISINTIALKRILLDVAATKEALMTATKTEIVSARSISKEKNAINAKTTTSDFLFAKLVIVMLMDQLINNAMKMELVYVKTT